MKVIKLPTIEPKANTLGVRLTKSSIKCGGGARDGAAHRGQSRFYRTDGYSLLAEGSVVYKVDLCNKRSIVADVVTDESLETRLIFRGEIDLDLTERVYKLLGIPVFNVLQGDTAVRYRTKFLRSRHPKSEARRKAERRLCKRPDKRERERERSKLVI